MDSEIIPFRKRAGTSGISGHLYETKLISLVLFRLLHDDDVNEFYLASNMDDIGSFDDLCLKAKIAGTSKPILIFIQAKHKDDDNTNLNYNVVKNFHASLVKIKEQINLSNTNKRTKHENIFFQDKFDDIECLFILYTNGRFFDISNAGELEQPLSSTAPVFNETMKLYQSEFAAKLNDLIGTSTEGVKGCRLGYNNEDLKYVGESIVEKEIAILAEHFSKFLNDKDKKSLNIMLDEYILRYHVFLRQNVVDVSENSQNTKLESDKSEDRRDLTFKPDFFHTNDNVLTIFRDKIYEIILKNRGNTKKKIDNKTKDELISSFLEEPSVIKLSHIIDTYISYTNGKLEFLVDRPCTDLQKLEQIDISPSMVNEAQEITVKNFLSTLILKVPYTFGNLDLTLKGNQKKIDKRLNQLTSFLVDLCQRAECVGLYQIVNIGDDIEEGFLSPNGGIGGAVGNLLVYDNETKLMKFTENDTILKKNARSLWDQLNENIKDLSSYRFHIKAINFPKLTFDCKDEAKLILDKLLIYEKQSNHSGVEEMLKNEMKEIEKNNTTQTFPTTLDTMLVYYHHEIQKWWLSKFGTCLTKSKSLYQQAMKNVAREPQMCSLQNTYFNNIKNRIYVFNENAMNSFHSQNLFENIIVVTDVIPLMVMKVIQYFRNEKDYQYIVIDLNCSLSLPIKEFRALNSELNDTNKMIILICDSVKNSGACHKRLASMAESVEEKKIIVITNEEFMTTIDLDVLKEYFSQISNVLNNEKVVLTDLVLDSKNDLIARAKVIFQGQKMTLKSIADKPSFDLIKGHVLYKIIHDETISIGESLSNPKYEEIKPLYVDRRISRAKNTLYVKTFNDIVNDYVLITAEPGMGKSILLTHLSVKAKEDDTCLWILRINLLDHSKFFHNLQNSKTVINTMETIKFLCQLMLKNKEYSVCLGERNDKYFLKDSIGDELTNFEINIFLQFYNDGKLLLLFDGFDEICPHYKDNALKLLNNVKNFPRGNRMWVTSRPYNEILPDLKKVLGEPYKIEYINDEEQEDYMKEIWKFKLAREKLTDIQLSNIRKFADCISERFQTKRFPETMHFTFHRMYYLFYDFVQTCIFEEVNHLAIDIQNTFLSLIVSTLKNRAETEAVASTSTASQQRSSGGLVDQLVGTPLLLYLAADYFVNIINNNDDYNSEWELNIHIVKVYESFIVSKFRNILFEDKNKIDVYKPDVITRYEKDLADCISMHKKLAAYVLLKNKIFYDVCPLEEFKDMQSFDDDIELKAMIDKIKNGTEKTGIINQVTLDNVPVFIHKTFAEYFATEFLCDIFKRNIEFDRKRLLLTTIYIYGTIDIKPWLQEKRSADSDLDIVIKDIINKKPVVLTWHAEFFSRGDWSIEHLTRLLNSCPDDYEVDWCSDVTEDFADTLNCLTPQERQRTIRHFQTYVLAKMKPHLKQYFPPVIILRGYKQMLNWMGGKLLLP